MKKLLATTALATLAMSGHASAQSLLESLLTNADELSASITNLAQNSGTLDASITVDTSRNIAGIDAIVDTLMTSGDPSGFGSVSVAGANEARDFALPDLSFLAPLEMTMGDLATTGIGAMQSGSMDVSFDASGLESRLADSSESSTTMAESIDETYGSIEAGLSFQNVAYNTAGINADINLVLDDVNATLGNLATTAIGAMGSGDLAASITGQVLDGDLAGDIGTGTDTLDSGNLIQALLNNIGDVSASISNIAQNSGGLDASIDIDTSRSIAAGETAGSSINDVLATLAGTEGFGSTASAGVALARDFAMPDMSFLDPLQLTLGDLATTGIGAMQSGSMDVSFDASGLASLASDVSSGSTTMAETITETYGAIDAGLSFQNVAFNTADIDAFINLALNDVNTTTGNLATTAIGAMGSGDLTASITGTLADTSATLGEAGTTQSSELDTLLAEAEDLSAAITNLAENQGGLDANVSLTTGQSLDDINTVLATLAGADGFGSYSEVAADVYAYDNQFPNMAFLAPLEATIGDIATTGIGAMQSGNLTVSFDASGLMDMTSNISSGESTSASTIAQNYGGIESGLAIQNVAFNDLAGGEAADINASINLALNDVNATVGNLATTAIGAMGSGDLTANLVGRLVGDTSFD